MKELNFEELNEVNGGLFGLVAVYAFQVGAIILTFVDEK